MKLNLLKLFSKHSDSVSKLILIVLLIVFAFPPLVQAAGSLTTVKDTLTNDRPSVATPITVAVTAGDTTITVGSTLGIAQGDTINLCVTQASCSGGSSETKVVSSVVSVTQLSLTVGTANSYTTSGYVYLKIASKHTVTFTTRSAVSNGSFVLTLASGATANTSTPATAGFVFNQISTTTDVTVSGFTAATTATGTAASNLTFTFTFSGSVASNTAITLNVGSTTDISMLNPTKTAAGGTADTFSFKVDEKDNGGNVIDTTSGNVGTIESVTVSATVSPSLTFTINSVSSGTSVTSHNTVFGTSATSVPFGTLTVNASTTGAQFIHVDTNSNSGYAVTVQQDGSLRKSNGTAITDFSSAAANEHDGGTGFGYSLQSKAGSPTLAFNFNDSGRKFNAIGFSSTTPATVMSNTAPANGDETYVDYYLDVNAQQAQGTYQNLITYIATASY